MEKGPEIPSAGPKRVVYGSKKKKPTVQQQSPIARDAAAIPVTPTKDTTIDIPPAPVADVARPASPDLPEDVKDEWDASTDEDIDQTVTSHQKGLYVCLG